MAQAGRVASSGVASRERCHANQGRGSGFGRRRDAWGGQVASPAYGAAVGEVQGETEVEESVSGNFVIRPKFQNPVL